MINYNLRPSYMDNGDEAPEVLGSFDLSVKRRLSDEFLDPVDPTTGDKIKTYLRIRPPSTKSEVDPSVQVPIRRLFLIFPSLGV